mgnify:CR=1 FL=1
MDNEMNLEKEIKNKGLLSPGGKALLKDNPDNYIKIRGARQNNLKNIDLDIPRDKLVVITGLSGSGKSSLAFDTIYAEGQRRYVESLSSYARMFLGVMDKPDFDTITGLSPAISIDQKSSFHCRYGHRSLRLSTSTLRPCRRATLSNLSPRSL